MSKTTSLLLISSLTLFLGCELTDLGKTDCAIRQDDELNILEYDYRSSIDRPDSQGNLQSLEFCLRNQSLTKEYIDNLKAKQYYVNLNASGDCTDEEKVRLNTEINEKTRKLEEDLVSTWNRCNEVYN